jgi:hypothetical protein
MLLCANPQSNAGAIDGNYVGTRLRLTKSRPGFHESPPLFECIAAPVGLFGLGADDMSQSGLRYFARKETSEFLTGKGGSGLSVTFKRIVCR